ncbi:hypothetical protein [Synechococcus sp. SynAce01]|uniref:hypothetical protein n=1 Tax=Synechococcus sp. SynAce01 TaxID=1916956 RepID=UPI0008FF5FE9|nr:hypothetical protein [Synechococcus sp. SynAce01]APD47016.1 hypothetical protein BM449_00135 [Synechococcus sp. SynAce01]
MADLSNLQHWLSFFCTSTVTRASLGAIAPLSPQEAAGFIGCMIVETGSTDLSDLDVIEAGSGAGRGAMQYTGLRRPPYDAAREQALSEGIDPNSNEWQEIYFAQEYAGLHDPAEGSLIGWCCVFETARWPGSSCCCRLLDRSAEAVRATSGPAHPTANVVRQKRCTSGTDRNRRPAHPQRARPWTDDLSHHTAELTTSSRGAAGKTTVRPRTLPLCPARSGDHQRVLDLSSRWDGVRLASGLPRCQSLPRVSDAAAYSH